MDIIRTVSTALQEQLGDELDELARECHIVIREREFTGKTLLLMIVVTPSGNPMPPGPTSTSPLAGSASKSRGPRASSTAA